MASLANPIVNTVTFASYLTAFPSYPATLSSTDLIAVLVVQMAAFGHLTPTLSAGTRAHLIFRSLEASNGDILYY